MRTLSFFLVLWTAPLFAAPRVITVDCDPRAEADFHTIQAALDSIPVANQERIVIDISNGLYSECVRLNQSRVTLRGESRKGVKLRYFLPREEYHRRYDDRGPAVLNVFGKDVVLQNLTIDNEQTSRDHAFAVYGQPQRLIIDNCDVVGNGGDTLSLWNTAFGMYYHRNCRFRGGVDFVCPRGWCFVRDCQFECPTTSAAIWQDGHMDLNMKFVLRDCHFDGVENFWLGRNHYPSQFYLLGCRFGKNMSDKPIGVVSNVAEWDDESLYQRKYFYDCHREGGDYAWHADNLETAAGTLTSYQITPAWTFGHRWDPESEGAPTIVDVEIGEDRVFIHWSEPVAGALQARVERTDGSLANYESGDGTRCLVFRGGAADAAPRHLALPEADSLYGTVATLSTRYVSPQDLPAAQPRKTVVISLIGDSTVTTYDFGHAYQGWGTGLHYVLDNRVSLHNFARGGRSSKSFRDEGHWAKARETPADYVFIQFGHNDNPGKGPERYTDPAPGGTYRSNLRRYIEETRAMGAKPILVSPPTRRFFDETGRIKSDEGNIPYAAATLAVADEMNCPVIDLNGLTRTLFERLGETHSDWLQPVGDRTHFTPVGSFRVACMVAEKLLSEVPELAPMVLVDRLDEHYLPGN